MIRSGILNPWLNHLLSRVRHTNALVIADPGFPFWPMIETIDISLIDGVPTVLQVIVAVRPNFVIGQALMAEEFFSHNPPAVQGEFAAALVGISLAYEAHETHFKPRVPSAIGLIRTGDTTPYGNIILISA